MLDSVVIKLLIALLLGMLIGLERILTRNGAGMRTYGLVSMGAALFMIIALEVGVAAKTPGEVLRVLGQIVSSIGFLGVGFIYFSKDEHMRVGVTSAAGLLVVAGIGAAVGLGLHKIAFVATLFTMLTFTTVLRLEQKLEHKFRKDKTVSQDIG
jgi:putative Mg2+ transporter-C (MgtC) family protein